MVDGRKGETNEMRKQKEEENTERDKLIKFIRNRRKDLRTITWRDMILELISLVKELEDRVKKLEERKK